MENRTCSPPTNQMITEESDNYQSLESGQQGMPSDSLSTNHINGMTRQIPQRKRPSRSEGSGPVSQNILFRILSGKHDAPPWGTASISENHASVYGNSPEGVSQSLDPSPQPDISLTYEADDLVDLSGRVGFGNGLEFLTPNNDYRQRSQSMGSNFGFGGYSGGMGSTLTSDQSRTSSHDSLASFDSQSDSGQPTNNTGERIPHSHSDVQLEATRSRLKHLLMGGGTDQGSAPSGEGSSGSLSHPGTPPSSTPNYQITPRKYSEGSQRSHLKAKLMNFRGGAGGVERGWARGESSELQRYLAQPAPQVVSARRRKPYSRPSEYPHRQMDTLCDDAQTENTMLADEGYDDGNSSLLKMMLTRGRSNSVSVFDSYRPTGSAIPRCHTMSMGGPRRQHVTLAKKNLLPIAARVSDRLNKVIEFATSLPEFNRMSVSDQMTLLKGACPRLLLLYMAEMNLQFAVTPVHEDGTSSNTLSPQTTGAMPTVQFVEAVQTFIRKCQTMNVTANEYFYMRMIALFRTGPGSSLQASEAAERIHSEARQDLQEVVQHSHPEEKLRYITLLLTLHTLFSINCAMLQVLFCDPIISSSGVGPGSGGLEDFIRRRLEEKRAGDQEKSESRTSPKLEASESSSSSASATPTKSNAGLTNGFYVPTVTSGGLTNGFVESAVTTVELSNGYIAPVGTSGSANGFMATSVTSGLISGYIAPAVTTVGLANGFLAPAVTTIGLTHFSAPTTTGSWSIVGTS